MLGIPLEAAVQSVTGVTHGHIPDEGIGQKIDGRRQSQRAHGIHRKAACKKIHACGNAQAHDREAQPAIKIFLDIKRVMTAGYTGSNETAIEDGGVHENFNRLLAMGTRDPIGFRRSKEDLILTGSAFEMYNGGHETFGTASFSRSVRPGSNSG